MTRTPVTCVTVWRTVRGSCAGAQATVSKGEFDAGKPTAKRRDDILVEVAAASLPVAEPAPVAPVQPAAAVTATPSAVASQPAAAFNAARDSAALKRFVDSF